MRWAPLLALLLLTRPDGHPIWIVDAQVVAVTDNVGGAPGANSTILTLGGTVYVREKPEDVASKLGWKP